MNNNIYLTITHLYGFDNIKRIKPNDTLKLIKQHDNPYDDEAILAFNLECYKCGYVANSIHTVYRGTYSAGRLYDKMAEETLCRVLFVSQENLICELIESEKEK